MTSTFAVAPEGIAARVSGPFNSAEMRFSEPLNVIKAGTGEAVGSSAAPFARYASKMTFPMSGEGAIVVASVPSDTTTRSGGRADDSSVDDR